MNQQVTYTNRFAEAFGMKDAPTLITRTLHKSTMTVTELKCYRPNSGKTASIPREDAYLVALQLRACVTTVCDVNKNCSFKSKMSNQRSVAT
jgi:AraC family transcriptional regulator